MSSRTIHRPRATARLMSTSSVKCRFFKIASLALFWTNLCRTATKTLEFANQDLGWPTLCLIEIVFTHGTASG